jgi:hypothetical protein
MLPRSAQTIRRPVVSQASAVVVAAESGLFRTRFLVRHETTTTTSSLRYYHPQRRNFSSASKEKHIRPYSDSLPSPGSEWCSRCQIRTHHFQKPQDQHNACLDTPRLFGLGVCASARQYYQQQVAHMVFLSLFCFAAAPLYNATTTTHAQEEEEDQ